MPPNELPASRPASARKNLPSDSRKITVIKSPAPQRDTPGLKAGTRQSAAMLELTAT